MSWHRRRNADAACSHVCMYVCLFNVLGTNWGPTDRVLFMQIQSFKILLLREKQFLIKPPHALGSFLDKKSATVQPCWKRSALWTLRGAYAGQSKRKCCSSSTACKELHTRHSLSPRSMHELLIIALIPHDLSSKNERHSRQWIDHHRQGESTGQSSGDVGGIGSSWTLSHADHTQVITRSATMYSLHLTEALLLIRCRLYPFTKEIMNSLSS